MPTNINLQIERRRQRAREEITKIVNKGSHPLFSQFEVGSILPAQLIGLKSIPSMNSITPALAPITRLNRSVLVSISKVCYSI